jgi:5-methylcytosine-specific restriction endonuclease McrA
MTGLKFAKPPSKARDKRQARTAKERAWQRVRAAVFARDGRICRACQRKGGVEVHHIRFRSTGGEDSTSNTAALCRECHADVHAYRLTMTGDANGRLKIERTA